MNLTTIAEGVENKEDWDLVKSLGCDCVQGYLISKPLRGPQLLSWYKQYSPLL